MRDNIRRDLRTIACDERLEARWLNTLSYLAFAGARKISRTVAASHPSADVLEHLADQSRRAAAFARLAERVLGTAPSDYLCRDAATTYFNKLDRELSAWATELVGQPHPSLNYLLVTSMIERRAMTLYPLYRSMTANVDVREELDRIIDEDKEYRVRIEEDCIRLLSEWNITDLAAPSAVESAFFAEFWRALEAVLEFEEPVAAAIRRFVATLD